MKAGYYPLLLHGCRNNGYVPMLTFAQVALPIAGAILAVVLLIVSRVTKRPGISRLGRWLFFLSLAAWPIFTAAIIVQAIIDPNISIGVTKLKSINSSASLSVSSGAFLAAAVARLAVAAVVFVLALRLVKPSRRLVADSSKSNPFHGSAQLKR